MGIGSYACTYEFELYKVSVYVRVYRKSIGIYVRIFLCISVHVCLFSFGGRSISVYMHVYACVYIFLCRFFNVFCLYLIACDYYLRLRVCCYRHFYVSKSLCICLCMHNYILCDLASAFVYLCVFVCFRD